MKDQNYISWDKYFMGVAKLSSMRSKDPSTQVGACIVSNDNRILSIGYNGAPNNFDDDLFPWNREGNPIETKYMYVCHAEANAIISASRKDMIGSTIFLVGTDVVEGFYERVGMKIDDHGRPLSKGIFHHYSTKIKKMEVLFEKIMKTLMNI